MSFGKMNTFIDICITVPSKDLDGFVTEIDGVVKSIRAYKEDRHGNERWANLAAFSTSTALLRFRKIPNFEVLTSMVIKCTDGRYRINSVENSVRGRKMYTEVLAEKIEPTKR